ncbi:GNAT family N-acetyltransferase [Paenibacillus sp. GCM10027627]|uniref:GNAT family N-acetyltransferase n=1 Tax=unclassified Paenibacillus TaxID=185978 RepID=UPI0036389858
MTLQYKRLNAEVDEIPYGLLELADPSKSMVEDYIRRGQCYLAFLEKERVGQFVLLHTHPKTIEIVNISVEESFQGRGFGKELVLKAIETAKQLGARSIEIGTGNSSIQQLRLYQKCGFRIASIDHDFFVRHYEEEIIEDGIACRDMIRLRLDIF